MSLQSNMKLRLILCISLVLMFEACGGGGGGGSTSSAATNSNSGSTVNTSVGTAAGTQQYQTIQIPLTVSGVEGLNLLSTDVNADSFVIDLTGCASGLTGTNGTPGILNVYLGDTSCIAKLSSLVLHSQSYVPSGTGSVPFTTWLTGNAAVFVGASASDLISVTVESQLSSPIVNTDTVSYSFTVLKGESVTTVTPSSESISLLVGGTDAPNFEINSGDATYVGLSGGLGVFNFNVTCTTGAMTVGTNISFNTFCPSSVAGGTMANSDAGVDIGNTNNFSYKLIADVNGNGTLTIAQAQAAFTAGGDSTVNPSTDILSGSTGFQISSITGPNPINSNNKMILILQAKNTSFPGISADSSFQFFPVTVSTITP